MTAIAAITLADGQATPANHTFNPTRIDAQGVAKWVDRSGGIALGFPSVSFSMREPQKGSRNYKVTAKVVTPVLEVTSPSTSTGIQPAPTKAYELITTVDFSIPERATQQQRKDMLAYVKNFLANGVMTAAINDFEQVYG